VPRHLAAGAISIAPKAKPDCVTGRNEMPNSSPPQLLPELMMRLKFVAVLLAASASHALAAPSHSYDQLAISDVGDRVASIELSANTGESHGLIVVRSVADGRILASVDPCPSCAYSGLTFGPDGSLAFLARDHSAGTVALVVGQGNATRTVATIKGIAQTPRFAPDGKRVALLVTLNAAKESGATQPGVRLVGEAGGPVDEQRLAVFDLDKPTVTDVTPVSPSDRYVYEYAWTPDGRSFVATTAPGDGDSNWWVATLDAIDASTGAVRTIIKPPMQISEPHVSPDGRSVAFIGGLMSDYGAFGGDIWTVPFAGGELVDITKGEKATVTSIAWTTDGLRSTRLVGQDWQIARSGKTGTTVSWARAATLEAGDGFGAVYSADGKIAATVVSDFEHGPAIYAGPAGDPRKITSDNDGLRPLTRARSISWKSDGYDVQGWLLAPLGVGTARKAPMVTVVHGGPAAANVPSFVTENAPTASLLAAGYYVFLPNPRGSFGQGEAFTQANRLDWGGGDLRDILAGIDAAEKIAPIDDDRLGLSGSSYGGYMGMLANTQTHRFKAIVAGAGVSDLVSYYGTNGISQWMIPYFGKSLYDDSQPYEMASAITFVRAARTPTFIYAGERDVEVPPSQSVEYWHALKERGVPTTLVIYAGEGHHLRDPAHLSDLSHRLATWWAEYLGRQ
jgi:dipeptidyl aminopeptidase/acylaminoacyl peptidase